MHCSKEYDHENHFEKHGENVTVSQEQSYDTENSTERSLNYGQPEGVETFADFIVRGLCFGSHVRVTDMRSEINGEADTHNQVNHGY